MTRPIEKVKRDSNCQKITLALNIFVLGVFVFAGIYDYNKHKDENVQIIILGVATLMFLLTVIFYTLTIMLEPGYVPK
jgi:Na+/melibiose symporter-like transporter